MSNDDQQDANTSTTKRSFFAVPPALKRIFDKFPLVTYTANDFPVCSTRPQDDNVLYIFTTPDGAKAGAPSFNPACLKWQTFLRIRGVPFVTASSNNHASPSGSLPFVITAPRSTQAVIPVKGLRKWITKEARDGHTHEPADVRYEAYSSLLDGRIRLAWLYQLYLLPDNAPVMRRLYVDTNSSNYFVRLAIQQQLYQAANTEVRKAALRPVLDTDMLREAREALSALSSLLADKSWFFEDKVSLFDAGVFAYTHLLLDQQLMQWHENPLGDMLREYDNLVAHRDRILDLYY